ncbi:MAG: BatA and WFA domain-containing protein [Candidatus Eremiobacteraeota bacterium]|nr:BatA and WFA domain-containing protein [Candidatus Eremiobacteraeota bacterium]
MKDWGWNAPSQVVWLWVPLVLLLLYLFRPRHRPQSVAAAFLWRRVADKLGGQSLWLRLQSQRLLWLQLLFCTLVILALLRPYQVRPGLVARQVVLIVDLSASMGAADRLPASLAEARQIVRQAPNGCEFALATLDTNLQMLQPFSEDRVSLDAQLAGLQVQAVTGQDKRVAPLVLSLLKNNPQAQIHWFSDHPLPGVNCIAHLADQGRVNYAIDSFQSSPEQLFLALRNYDGQAAQLRVRIRGAEDFLVERVCSLRGRGRHSLQIPLVGSQGPYRAEILTKDDLSLDNQAFCLEAHRVPMRLISHGQVPLFLEQAAQAATGLTLLRGEIATSGIHLWSTLPESRELPPGRHIAAAPPASWVRAKVEDEGPILLPGLLQRDWRFRVSSQRWGARQSLQVGLNGIEPVLVDSTGEALLVQRQQALVWLFPLENSDLPLSPDLPVILSSWLKTHTDPSQAQSVGLLCGTRARLDGPAPLQLKGPRGTIRLEGLEWQPTWPGLYRYEGGQLAVNFYSPEESDLDRPKLAAQPAPPVSEELLTRPMSQEYTLPLIALGLLVLLWEYRCWWGDKR